LFITRYCNGLSRDRREGSPEPRATWNKMFMTP
jgi:hypothetical protein